VLEEKGDLGEQALSKAAEVAMKTQLDEVEKLDVNIRTDPFKLVQGQLDSVEIEGEGLVMQKDLRAEEVQVTTNQIAINPLSAAFGKIELTHPAEADAQVVLTEQDIERAFNSEFVHEKLQNLEVNLDEKPAKINIGKIEFRLPGESKVALNAEIVLKETGETKQIAFTAMPRMSSIGQRISLEDVQYTEGKEASPEVTAALLKSSSELLDLDNFELTGMSFTIKSLDVQPGKLTIHAQAYVEKFPEA
jgi:LmeA-like phospholipid-binding